MFTVDENRPIRVLVIDESPSIADGLGLLVNSSRKLTSVSHTHRDIPVAEAIDRLRPNVVLGNPRYLIRLIGQPLRALTSSCPETRFLAFSDARDATAPDVLLADGFSGGVHKTCTSQHLLKAITIVAMGGQIFDSAGGEANSLMKQADPVRPAAAQLTPREEAVLRQVAMGRAIKEIAASINLSQKTVETYKARAVKKLSLNNRSEIVQFALICGWLAH